MSGNLGAVLSVGAGSPAMRAIGSGRQSAVMPSRASPLPQWVRPASSCDGTTKLVGAGLPAMQAIGSGRQSAVMPSRASPLPQWIRLASGCDGTTKLVGAGLPAMQAIGSGRQSAVMPSRASPLPQWGRPASDFRAPQHLWGRPASSCDGATKLVGAGLPAMQAIGSDRQSAVMPSRASPLPQWIRPTSGFEGFAAIKNHGHKKIRPL